MVAVATVAALERVLSILALFTSFVDIEQLLKAIGMAPRQNDYRAGSNSSPTKRSGFVFDFDACAPDWRTSHGVAWNTMVWGPHNHVGILPARQGSRLARFGSGR